MNKGILGTTNSLSSISELWSIVISQHGVSDSAHFPTTNRGVDAATVAAYGQCAMMLLLTTTLWSTLKWTMCVNCQVTHWYYNKPTWLWLSLHWAKHEVWWVPATDNVSSVCVYVNVYVICVCNHAQPCMCPMVSGYSDHHHHTSIPINHFTICIT